MNRQAKLNLFLLMAGFCISGLMNCSPEKLGMDGGPTTQTGNGMIAGAFYEADGKTPACNAYVFLRKRNANVLPTALMNRNSDTVASVRTACNGTFTIDSIDTGLYSLEGSDGGNNLAFIDSVSVHTFDSTVVLPPASLKPAGAIKGKVRLSEGGDPRKVFVIIAAIGRFITADSGGAFKLERLAEGAYAINILPTLDNYNVVDTIDVRVKSADTTDIGIIDLPFKGLPTIKNIASTYDTFTQRVTVSWSKPSSRLVRSYNMYRRAVDPTTAIFAQLNFYPIADTMFIDSQCEPGRTYEYRATAVDSEANEGPRSLGVTAKITLYNIVPGNITLVYDTFEQAITLRWSNPDSSRIKGFNVYRRNIDLDEKFWTPYNASPVSECSFVDSAYGICPLCPTYDFPHGDSQAVKPPTYEYCLAALVNGVREGLRSTVVSVDVSVGYITPVDVKAVYDSVKMTVNLSWDVGDTMLIKGFNVYRKAAGDLLTPINGKLVKAKAFSDSGIDPNSTYEYRIASLIKNDRAEVKSAAVTVSIGP